MVVTGGLESSCLAARFDQNDFATAANFSDAVERKTVEVGGELGDLGPGNGEQQLVVLPAVECEFYPVGDLRRGEPTPAQAGSHAARFAKVMEVGREAVTDVDHRRRQPLVRQEAPQRALRHRVEVGANGSSAEATEAIPARLEKLQAESGQPQPSADKDLVAGTRPGAFHSPSRRGLARDDHIHERFLRHHGRVPAYELRAEAARQSEQASIKPFDPTPARPARDGQRDQSEARRASHGCDVTEGTRQRPMPDRARWVKVRTKVDALDRKVGGQHQQSPTRQLDHRRIVANAEAHPSTRFRQKRLEPANEFCFRSELLTVN